MTESEGKGEESIRGHSDSFDTTEPFGLRVADVPNEGRDNGEILPADDALMPVWQKIAFEVEVHSAADDNDEETQRKTGNNDDEEDDEEENDKFRQTSAEERVRIDEDGEEQGQRNQYFNFTVVEEGAVTDSADLIGRDDVEKNAIGEDTFGLQLLGQSERELTTVFKSVDGQEVSQASYESVGMTVAAGNDAGAESKVDEESGQSNAVLQTLQDGDGDDGDHHQQQQLEFPPSKAELEQFQVSSSGLSSASLVRGIAAETPYNVPTAFVQINQPNPAENQLSVLNQAKLLQGSLTPTTLILIDPSKDRRKQLADCMLIQNGSDGSSPIFLLQLTGQPLQTAVVNPDYSGSGNGSNSGVQHFLGEPGFVFHSNLRIPDAGGGVGGGGDPLALPKAVIAPAGDSMTELGISRLEGAETAAAGGRKSDRLKSKNPVRWKTSKNLDEISEDPFPPPNRKRRTSSRHNSKHPGDHEKLARYGDEDTNAPCLVVGPCDALASLSNSAGEGRGRQLHQQQQLPLSVTVSTGNGSVAGSSTRMFTCVTCNKDFTTEKYLSMHLSLHINDNGPAFGSLTAAGSAGVAGLGGGGCAIDELPIRRSKATVPGATAQWTCKICEKTFAQNSNYKNHIRTHSNERPFVCEICSIGFKERYHLKKHVLFKHTSELKEKCRHCDKCFKDSTAVRAHERTHSDQRPYPCPRCDKTFKTSECLWHHVNRSKTCGKSLGDMPPPCLPNQPPLRGFQTPGITSRGGGGGGGGGGRHPVGLPGGEECFVPAVAHEQVIPPVESVHLSSSQEEAEGEGEERGVDYQMFTPEAATLSQLNAAASSSWSIQGLQAVALPAAAGGGGGQGPRADNGTAVLEEGPVLAVKVEMEMNIFDYDLTGINSPETSSLEDYCEEFERETEEDDEEELLAIASVTGTGTVFSGSTTAAQTPCSPQGLVAGTPRSLLQASGSKRIGGGGGASRLLDCGTCGKQCATQSAFDKHSIVHSESRPHRCDECNVGFKLKVHLKKHNLYRHSDEYPCECSICGKRFKDSSAVRLHERIHSTERPFKCHCGKGFKTRENLWGHRHRGPCDNDKPGGGGGPGGPPGNFLLQNLRVFDSDIGPIWGVPLAADQEPTTPVESDDFETNQTTTCHHHQQQQQRRENEAISANAYDFLVQGTAGPLSLNRGTYLKTLVKKEAATDVHDHMPSSSSSSSAFVTRPSPHSFWSSQSSLFSNPSSSFSSLSLSGAHPPTAVVVPIKRESNEASTAATTLATTSSSSSSSSGEKCSLPPFETLVTTHRPGLTSSSSTGVISGVTAAGVGDRCPKVLLTGKDPSSLQTKLPGIQQLFQANPAAGGPSALVANALGQYRLQDELTGGARQVLHSHDRGRGGGGSGNPSLLSPTLLPVLPPLRYLHASPSCPADVIVAGVATEMSASTSGAFWGGEEGRGGEGGGEGGEEKLVSPSGVDAKNCYALQWMTSLAAQTMASKQTTGQFSMGPGVGRY